MRVVLALLLGVCVHVSWGQSLDAVDIGHLMGEMEHFESSLTWTNAQKDTLNFELWSGRPELSFTTKTVSAAPGQSVSIPYQIDLTNTKGAQSYEVRLIGAEEVILHGWLLQTRVFEAEEDVFKEYRNEFYPFRIRSMVLNLKAGFRGDVLSRKFSLFNFGGENLELEGTYTNNPQVSIAFEPQSVMHNAFTRMSVSLSTNDQTALGFSREKLSVFSADSSLLFTIPLQSTIEKMPAAASGAVPHLTVSKLTHDFKVIAKGGEKSIDIRLTNTGHSSLTIEKLEPNCDCLTFELGQKELAAGESTELHISFNASDRQGYERKTIALFTNDPDQPTKVLTFKAHVK